jgi:hypothetical protein
MNQRRLADALAAGAGSTIFEFSFRSVFEVFRIDTTVSVINTGLGSPSDYGYVKTNQSGIDADDESTPTPISTDALPEEFFPLYAWHANSYNESTNQAYGSPYASMGSNFEYSADESDFDPTPPHSPAVEHPQQFDVHEHLRRALLDPAVLFVLPMRSYPGYPTAPNTLGEQSGSGYVQSESAWYSGAWTGLQYA